MKFMEQLQTDLNKAIRQHQHQLLLEVLQQRSQELTLGDLRKLLASPLGRGLDEVRLALVFGAVPTPKKGQPAEEVKRKKTRVRRKPDKHPVGRPKVGPERRFSPSQDLVEAVATALQSAKSPLSSSEIGTRLNVHRTTVRAALQKLDAQKRITTSGKGKFTRYGIKSVQPTASDSTPSVKRRNLNGKPAKKVPVIAKKVSIDDPSYDAAVLACLQKGRAASSEILTAVGGTIKRLRASLIRLVASGQITRTGQHRLTRYELQGHADRG
jgi:hypothetical protein